MQMEGQQLIPAPLERVWEALNDPETLRLSIPGCETVEKSSDTEFQANVTAKFGPVKAKFKGHVTLSDIDPPHSYTLTGEGKGGAAGFGKGEAKVSLQQQEDQTLLTYTVNAKVGGKLAQIGSRLVDSAAKKMADDFFKAFSENLTSPHAGPNASPTTDPETGNASEENVPTTDTSGAPDSSSTSTKRETSNTSILYWGGALALLLLAIYFLS